MTTARITTSNYNSPPPASPTRPRVHRTPPPPPPTTNDVPPLSRTARSADDRTRARPRAPPPSSVPWCTRTIASPSASASSSTARRRVDVTRRRHARGVVHRRRVSRARDVDAIAPAATGEVVGKISIARARDRRRGRAVVTGRDSS